MLQFDFQTALHGLVKLRLFHAIGHVGFTCGIRMRLIVGVAVFVAIAQFFHQFGGRIAQMHRHFARGFLLYPSAGLVVSIVARVAFGGASQVNHRLPQSQFAFRRAQSFISTGGIVGNLHGARVGQAYVFPSHAHDASGQIARVGAAV